MRLRTKLIIAFFFLAIVPLVTIVLFGYSSSQRAFRAAVEAESRQLAEVMNERMAGVRDNLDEVLGRAAEIRYASLEEHEAAEEDVRYWQLEQEMAELGSLVETCEFIPAPPPVSDEIVRVEGGEEASMPQPQPTPPERIVFMINQWRDGPDDGDSADDENVGEMSFHFDLSGIGGREPAAQRSDEFLFEGSRWLAAMIEDPEAFEEMFGAKGEEIAEHVIDLVVDEGPELLAHAMSNSEALEKALAAHGIRLSEHILGSIPARLRLTEKELEELEAKRARAEALLGRQYSYEVRDGDRVLGHMRAQVSTRDVLDAVFAASRTDEGEVPFAIDSQGQVHTLETQDKAVLEALDLTSSAGVPMVKETADWIVVASEDEVSGTTFGIARPVGDALAEIQRTAFTNLAFGLFVVGLAGFGILPLSRRMTRHLSTLTDAAGKLAGGDLSTRVPVRSRDEFGQLASAFNRMAVDLDDRQNQLLKQERLRQEREVATRFLEVENQRKSGELEAARQFQLSLLPDRAPQHPRFDIAVAMQTATEVGGDYYDFREGDDGSLTIALGDATGHGAAAGTMVTVAKSLFTSARDLDPEPFLNQAASTIRGLRLGRMSMALTIARLDDRGLTVSIAGMPPLLLHRAGAAEVEEILVPGLPLGGFRGDGYRSLRVDLEPGDTVLMMSDGFPELLNTDGQPLGYERASRIFADVVHYPPQELIEELEAGARVWRGECPQADDMTFLVLRRL